MYCIYNTLDSKGRKDNDQRYYRTLTWHSMYVNVSNKSRKRFFPSKFRIGLKRFYNMILLRKKAQ